MALQGSLKDLGIVELLQVPAAGRKTGQLVVASTVSDARLYYVNGRLVHAEMGGLAGQAVLFEILGWSEGEFEFRPDQVTDRVTISRDLHLAIMLALKERDEALSAVQVGAPVTAVAPERLAELLRGALAAGDVLLWACVQEPGGTVVATTATGAGMPAGLDELRLAVCALTRSYPRPSLRRLLVEDDLGTVVVASLDDGSALVVAAGKQAKLGPVSMVVDRLVRQLAEAC